MTDIYHNTVTIKTKGEQEASFTQMLDSWGTKLVQPRQAAYGGHNFTIDPTSMTVNIDRPGVEIAPKLTLMDKIKVSVGVFLKRVAAFFNKQIDAKYKLINVLDSNRDVKGLYEALQPTKKVSQKQGNSKDDPCVMCCVLCCEPFCKGLK